MTEEHPKLYSIQRVIFSTTAFNNIAGEHAILELYQDETFGGYTFRASTVCKGRLLNLLRWLEIEIQMMEREVERFDA